MESPGPVKPQRHIETSMKLLSNNIVDNDNSSETNLLISHSLTTPVLATTSLRSKHPSFHSSPSTPLLSSFSFHKESGINLPNSDSKLVKGSTPPHRLLLETSFTCTPVSSPGPRPDLRSHINIPGLSWEILSALEDQLLVGGSFGRALTEDLKSCAPLASPETLSETSSIVSRISLLMREASIHGPRIPSLHRSPATTDKPPTQKTGSGYCFYVDTPPPAPKKLFQRQDSSTDDDDEITPRLISPFPFITLDPILPESECEGRGRTESDITLKACDPSKCDQIEESQNIIINGVNSTLTSVKPTSSSSSSPSSSPSAGSEKELKTGMTSSLQSRDSGYADRSANGIDNIASEWENFLQGGLVTPQQEYGKDAPPHLPYYRYSSYSPQISPSSSQFFASREAPSTIISDAPASHSSSLSIATPLLNDLNKCVRKNYTSAKLISSESSV